MGLAQKSGLLGQAASNYCADTAGMESAATFQELWDRYYDGFALLVTNFAIAVREP